MKEFKGTVRAINGMADHVHLVVTVPPTLPLSMFIGQIKGSSSHLASHVSVASTDFATKEKVKIEEERKLEISGVIVKLTLPQHYTQDRFARGVSTCTITFGAASPAVSSYNA